MIDPDNVDMSNLASQGYSERDLHRFKVEATALLCKHIDTSTELSWLKQPFRRSMEIGNIVFCAVDEVSTRRFIWEALQDEVRFWCDGWKDEC
ncbi:MAG: ThiF family adenylyltransferase [Planctomycetota bacterium]